MALGPKGGIMTEAKGPIFAAGFQHVTNGGYEILYLPDLVNDELQREGKAPVYHWLPNEVRLARKDGVGDHKFHFIHFYGSRGAETNIGVVEDTDEVAGGLLGFSTTSAPPPDVQRESEEELLSRFRGSDDKYWGWRTPVTPKFRPAPIVSNLTSITNLSPNPGGTVPAVAQPPGEGQAPNGPPRARSFDARRPPAVRAHADGRGRALRIIATPRPPLFASPRGTVPQLRGFRGSNLDMWYANLQGQGAGSVSPFAENAYSGLVGSLPAALIWASFHGGTGGISVWQQMKIKVWSPVVHLHIEGDWDRIQDHFSGAAHAGGLFWSADIQAVYNDLRIGGKGLEVVVEVDTTLPNADKLQEAIDKRSDLVFQKFMEQAQKTIFEPAPFQEQAAQASGGFLGFGGGAAFKLRRDHSHLHLEYDERREMAYLQDYPISGQLEGLYDELKADPANEGKYFTTVYLGDWERKTVRVVKPVVNWPDPARAWAGQPVSFLSVQVGYPNTEGIPQWSGHMFQRTDGPDAVWNSTTEMKRAQDVRNPPPGWTPDQTLVKREVHLTEAATDAESPFAHVSIEQNVVELDPGEFGALTSDINLEVRVDNVGVLNVGPILLNVDLEDAKQVVEVTFQAEGKTAAGHERPATTFSWHFDDQSEPRYWMIFTGQPDYLPRFKYQVRVIVKGSIFTKGLEWTGPWQEVNTNGPLMVSVPTQEEAVSRRALPGNFASTARPPATARPPQTTARARRPVPVYGSRPRPQASVGGWAVEPPRGESKRARPRAPARAGGFPGQDDDVFITMPERPAGG
jgi:hypothetical protein